MEKDKIIIGCFQNPPLAGLKFGVRYSNGMVEYKDQVRKAGYQENTYTINSPKEGIEKININCSYCGDLLEFNILSEKYYNRRKIFNLLLTILVIPSSLYAAYFLVKEDLTFFAMILLLVSIMIVGSTWTQRIKWLNQNSKSKKHYCNFKMSSRSKVYKM